MVLLRRGQQTLRQKVTESMAKILKTTSAKANPDLAELEETEHHKALIDLVDHLMECPQKISLAAKIVKRPNFGESQAKALGDGEEASWPEQYTTWEKVPKYWIWALFMQKYAGLLSNELVAKVDSEDGKAARKILTLTAGIKPTTIVEPALRNKRLMAKCVSTLLEQHGHVFRAFVAFINKSNGKINWQTGGAIVPVNPGDGVAKVKSVKALEKTVPLLAPAKL